MDRTALIAVAAKAYEAASCPHREGPYGLYDYSGYGAPVPHVVRDFRPRSATYGAWVACFDDPDRAQAEFDRLTREHIFGSVVDAVLARARGRGVAVIFALLGDIVLGDAVWTGPTAAKETRKAAFAEIKVARGKPPIQDMGDDNDVKTLDFFFDETFCDAQVELSRLEAAFDGRRPLPLVSGDGSFDGVRWLIEEYSVDTLKTTPYGRPVRMRVSAKLRECPAASPLTFFEALARAGASALGTVGVGAMGAKR